MTLYDVIVIKETELAILITWPDDDAASSEQHWIPKRFVFSNYELNKEQNLEISDWIAKEKGLDQ